MEFTRRVILHYLFLIGLRSKESRKKILISQTLIFQVSFLSHNHYLGFIVEIKRFAYYFLAPTLIYRDTYVRTRKIRWPHFFKNLASFLILIFYVWCVFKALCIPIFKHTVNSPGGLRQFFNSVLFSTVSGIVVLLSLFYGVLHAWMNIFGELLQFGDRLFYEDWWNVRDFANYYRKWNIIVHEFLYYYVY